MIGVNKATLPALFAGAILMFLSPGAGFAADHGRGGHSYSRGNSHHGGRGYSRGESYYRGGHGYSRGGNYYRGHSYSHGGHNYHNRGYYDRGHRHSYGRYRGGFGFGFYSVPYTYVPGYYYDPGYYDPGYCNPPGYYDQWGYWHPYSGCDTGGYDYDYGY